MRQPMQRIVRDSEGTPRFHPNQIVRYLWGEAGVSWDELAKMPFSTEDWNQFAQLLGYSVCGFGDLAYADPKVVAKADAIAEKLTEVKP